MKKKTPIIVIILILIFLCTAIWPFYHNSRNTDTLTDLASTTQVPESTEENIAADTDYQIIEDAFYRNLIHEMLETNTFPATEGILCNGKFYNNKFSVMDIDEDGRDELLINWGNADYMAGMVLYIYDYDRETSEIYIEYAGWPIMTVYDNGYIREEASHNHGRSDLDDFWPYSLLKYNEQTDTYECVANIDGDGIMYYDISETDYKPTMIMDNAEYNIWCEQYSKGCEKKIIWHSIISEDKYYEMFPGQAGE